MTRVNIHSKASEGSSATRGHWTVKTEILRRGGAPGPRPVPPSWGVGLGPRARAGAGAAAGGTGAAAAPAGRGEGRVSTSSEEPGPRTLSSGALLTWIWSGSRSGSRSGTVTWSRSRTTWRTLSWSARRSALDFWICSETVRVHCGERPGEPQTPPARAGADAPPPVRLTDNSTLSSHVTLAMGAAAPGTFTVGCFTQDPGKDQNSPPIPAPRLRRDTTASLRAKGSCLQAAPGRDHGDCLSTGDTALTCSSSPGLSSAGPASLLGRTRRDRSAPSLHCKTQVSRG